MSAVDDWFTYHPPEGTQVERYQRIRETARRFARDLLDLCPPGHERDVAFDRLRETVMWANAGIACGEARLGTGPQRTAELYPDDETPHGQPG